MKKLIVLAMVFAALAGVAQAGQVVITGRVPDAGTTSTLMGIALAGLVAIRRFVR
jgi:VPDSG-CTERM motif